MPECVTMIINSLGFREPLRCLLLGFFDDLAEA